MWITWGGLTTRAQQEISILWCRCRCKLLKRGVNEGDNSFWRHFVWTAHSFCFVLLFFLRCIGDYLASSLGILLNIWNDDGWRTRPQSFVWCAKNVPESISGLLHFSSEYVGCLTIRIRFRIWIIFKFCVLLYKLTFIHSFCKKLNQWKYGHK